MRTSTWVLIACCTSLLVACGADLPAAEAAPEPLLATTSASLVTVTRIVASGSAADVGWQDELSSGYMLAGIDSTSGVATAFITGTQTSVDPLSQVCIADPLLGSYCHYTRVSFDSIFATINPSDLVVSGNTARLNTNLLSASFLAFTRCLYEEATVTTTCSNVLPNGLINLQWRKTPTDFIRSVGVTETKTGPHTVRLSGTRAFYSADTSGTMLGTVLQHKSGAMGTTKTLTIDILKTP